MYFKTIEMQGFKSFADRTVVNLLPGIAGVVGPNGCGKSNILDALRWALGEQSAKALRGSHMQDVIFNGSEHRPPMGMAEVSLVFDNADQRLPVDFAEVSITRRVYRSGESEYLLNRAPCRLKDIQELFMDTGIGTNAYSLIGQGKIDMVLSSKPEDRRYLFEEAAGIIKYKSRKRVAMRKLEQADQNLLRLSDIIAEVDRQMRTLKRQVNAAIRHRELTALLRELEIRNAWLQFNELSGQITDLREQFTNAQDRYEKASADLGTLEARAEELNLRRVELERMLTARREGEFAIDTEMEKVESAIALLRRDIEFAKQQQAQALQERDEYLQRAEASKSQHGEVGERIGQLAAEVSAARDAFAAKQQALNEAEAAAKAADATLEQMRAQAVDAIKVRSNTQTELETISVGLSNVDTQLEGILQRQQGFTGRMDELGQALEAAQRLQTERQTALTETVKDRQATQTSRQEESARMEALNKEWQELREQKSSHEARLRSLRELRDSYEGFATGVRAVMIAKQKNMPECQGVIGPVGDLLSTEKEYEKAIEAALGGNINNVVVSNADDAKSAINFLKHHQAGRVTFLPLDTIRSSSHDDSDMLRGKAGVIGRAIDYVQCDAQIMPAVEYLLYNTMIVNTIDDAIRIARSERRFPRLVTLDGEVISHAGAVTGGRTKNESRGLLGRSAEIEELERLVDTATKRISKVVVEAQALTEKIQQLAARLKQLEETEGQQRVALNEVSVSLAKTTTEFESLSGNVRQLTDQREALTAQRADLEARRVSVQERASSIETDEEALQRGIAEAQTRAAEARQVVATLADELADLRVSLAGLTQNVEEAERNRLREIRDQEEAHREAEKRLGTVEQLKQREAELESRIADNLERVKALSETKEEAHTKVLESQKEQHDVVEESDKINKRLKEVRGKSATAQKEVHHLELELNTKESQVQYFQERIASEYGLALGSLTEKDVGSDDHDETERTRLITEYRKDIQRLGTVNLMAIEEYEALEKRHEFLTTQDSDLRQARETLMSVVQKIDATILTMFVETFRTIEENFKNNFRRLFNGGQARIYLVDENDPLESGIEIEARPPGKKPQVISLLSGGEQAMTAIALLFGIFSAKPSPFCVLDEVDAPLDDANIGRFLSMVEEFTDRSQFIIITHSKMTMSRANALFGVTQQERGVSQLVSVSFEDVDEHGNVKKK